mgnify:FL=1
MNSMKQIHVAKLTLNVGAGRNQKKLEKGQRLIENLTGKEPVTTKAKKRIQGWKLRPGLPIGTKITIRGNEAVEIIKRILPAIDRQIKPSSVDNNGNISFGVKEYVDVDGLKYDTKIGMMGFQVSITLERPGFRVKKRKIQPKKIPDSHRISQEDAITFMEDTFNVSIEEQE